MADTILKSIIQELAENEKLVSQAEMEKFADAILKADRIFVAGAGRSGFVARAFANRLMHMGLTVFFVGEPTTPAIKAGDLLVIGSGSGDRKPCGNGTEGKEDWGICYYSYHTSGSFDRKTFRGVDLHSGCNPKEQSGRYGEVCTAYGKCF